MVVYFLIPFIIDIFPELLILNRYIPEFNPEVLTTFFFSFNDFLETSLPFISKISNSAFSEFSILIFTSSVKGFG